MREAHWMAVARPCVNVKHATPWSQRLLLQRAVPNPLIPRKGEVRVLAAMRRPHVVGRAKGTVTPTRSKAIPAAVSFATSAFEKIDSST